MIDPIIFFEGGEGDEISAKGGYNGDNQESNLVSEIYFKFKESMIAKSEVTKKYKNI